MIDAGYLQKRSTFGFLVMVNYMGAKRPENPLAFVAIFMCNKIRKLHTNKPPDMQGNFLFTGSAVLLRMVCSLYKSNIHIEFL